MTNQELFKQAIADAKSVRDAAVANAKAALEETFTPSIMNMLSAKLNEMEEDEDEKDEKKVTKEDYGMEEEGMEDEIGYEAGKQKPQIDVDNANDSIDHLNLEEMDLEEILAELEKEEGKMEEGKKEKDGKKEKVEEAKKDDEEEDEKSDDSEEASDDDEITELTVDELRDIIRDVLQDVMGGSEESSEEAPEEGGEEESDEESISLDELLAELDTEDTYTDELPHDDISGTEMGYVGGKKDVKGTEKGWVAEKKEKDGEKKVEEAKKEATKAKKDLEESIKVIKFLKKELNEVNLLNAKNTYVNKIFKAKSLSESQKVNVLKTMDKATNVKEAKVIYESLISNLSTSRKNTIKESVGFASKAAGVAPKQPIVESDAAIRRMQQLAGIIK